MGQDASTLKLASSLSSLASSLSSLAGPSLSRLSLSRQPETGESVEAAAQRDDVPGAYAALHRSFLQRRFYLIAEVRGTVLNRLQLLARAMELAEKIERPLLIFWTRPLGEPDSCSLRELLLVSQLPFALIEQELSLRDLFSGTRPMEYTSYDLMDAGLHRLIGGNPTLRGDLVDDAAERLIASGAQAEPQLHIHVSFRDGLSSRIAARTRHRQLIRRVRLVGHWQGSVSPLWQGMPCDHVADDYRCYTITARALNVVAGRVVYRTSTWPEHWRLASRYCRRHGDADGAKLPNASKAANVSEGQLV